MKRRRFRRSFAGKRAGRRFFWFRFTPFALTVQATANAVHSDILLQESDYYDPSDDLNEAQKGGARLERIIVDFGLAINAEAAFFGAGGDAQFALIPEFMIWKQSDQFASIVTNSTSFDSTRANQRIIMDEVPAGEREFGKWDAAGDSLIRSVQGRYESKSKVRLADAALGVAWRGLFDTGSANLNGYSDWVRPTMLISLP